MTTTSEHDIDDSTDAADEPNAELHPAPADSKADTTSRPEGLRAAGRTLGRYQILAAIVTTTLVVGVVVLAVLLNAKSDQLADRDADAKATAKAQQVALDYANGAATMNYQDLATWNQKLVAGTSPELKDKLTAAATSMEQVITPLQWSSTAQPIAAQVASRDGSLFIVHAFVNVTTKNAQAPDGVQSTATYTITLDSARNWLITDVGGVTPVGPR